MQTEMFMSMRMHRVTTLTFYLVRVCLVHCKEECRSLNTVCMHVHAVRVCVRARRACVQSEEECWPLDNAYTDESIIAHPSITPYLSGQCAGLSG